MKGQHSPKNASSCLTVLPGHHILNQKHAEAMYLQPTVVHFKATWEKMTDNALKGLD